MCLRTQTVQVNISVATKSISVISFVFIDTEKIFFSWFFKCCGRTFPQENQCHGQDASKILNMFCCLLKRSPQLCLLTGEWRGKVSTLGSQRAAQGWRKGKAHYAPLHRDGSPRTRKTLLQYDNLFLVNLCTIASIWCWSSLKKLDKACITVLNWYILSYNMVNQKLIKVSYSIKEGRVQLGSFLSALPSDVV